MSASSTGHAERARLRAAEDAAERIGTTLDARSTCAELARFVCLSLCDAAAVELLPDDAEGEHSPSARHPDGQSADAGAPAPLHRVAAEGRTRLLEPGGPTAPTPVSVPLLAHGHLYGVLRATRSGGGFTAHETATLHHAARLAAVHLAHARRHAAARRTALDLQRALLADPGRPHPHLELATRYLPADSITDGLVERRGEDIDVSLARLAGMRLPARAGLADVLDEVLLRLGGRFAEDDVAVLAARIRRR